MRITMRGRPWIYTQTLSSEITEWVEHNQEILRLLCPSIGRVDPSIKLSWKEAEQREGDEQIPDSIYQL